jgi:thiamine pyrophosphokinase
MTESCDGVSVWGVKWPLDRVTLERKIPWTISNEALMASNRFEVTASCETGVLALYWRF